MYNLRTRNHLSIRARIIWNAAEVSAHIIRFWTHITGF
jgi:hypothetical protein